MIAQLRGTITLKKDGFVVVQTSNVGYKVALTTGHIAELASADTATVWTYLVVRDDALELFGFRTYEELELFQLLLGVPGVGPRSALGILDLTSLEKLAGAIASGDSGYLSTVSGVGKKSAEKIVLELRDKVGTLAHGAAMPLQEDTDVLEALRSLGYHIDEARQAVKELPDTIEDPGERVKAALKLLSKS